MARVRPIARDPGSGLNYYVVDANFLANKYIPQSCAPNQIDKNRINSCIGWWKEICSQIDKKKARVFIPDICIAETFKVLAKKYYLDRWLSKTQFSKARRQLEKDMRIPAVNLKKQKRFIGYHDISTNRDIIISVDRFYEIFMKYKLNVSIPDLILLATAKYLIDFYDIPQKRLSILTMDRNLRKGSRKITELPYAYDPTDPVNDYKKIFISLPKIVDKRDRWLPPSDFKSNRTLGEGRGS